MCTNIIQNYIYPIPEKYKNFLQNNNVIACNKENIVQKYNITNCT